MTIMRRYYKIQDKVRNLLWICIMFLKETRGFVVTVSEPVNVDSVKCIWLYNSIWIISFFFISYSHRNKFSHKNELWCLCARHQSDHKKKRLLPRVPFKWNDIFKRTIFNSIFILLLPFALAVPAIYGAMRRRFFYYIQILQ